MFMVRYTHTWILLWKSSSESKKLGFMVLSTYNLLFFWKKVKIHGTSLWKNPRFRYNSISPSLPTSSKYLVSRCLDHLKVEPQEVFVGPNTYSKGIWKTRDHHVISRNLLVHPGRLTAGTYSHHPWKERKMIWTKPPGNYVPAIILPGL